MIFTLMRLQLLQTVHGGKGAMLAIVVVAPLVLAILFNSLGGFEGVERDEAELAAGLVLFALFTQFTCIIAGLFYGSSILSTELDWKTLTYLYTRPVSKSRIVLGKYLGIIAVLVPALVVSSALAWFGIGMPLGGAGLVTLVLLVALATVAYTALFAAIGVLIPKRAIIVGLIWGGVFEWALTYVPALISQITVTYYLRGLGLMLLDQRLREMMHEDVATATLPEIELHVALLGIAAITAVGLMVTSLVVQRREYATHGE